MDLVVVFLLSCMFTHRLALIATVLAALLTCMERPLVSAVSAVVSVDERP